MRIEDKIDIKTKADLVWAVTVDVERWSEWTPTVTSVTRIDDKPFFLGSTVHIKQPLQPKSKWTVTKFMDGKMFTWETTRAGLRMRASHEIQADTAWTKSVLRIEINGIVSVLLWPIFRFAVHWALSKENQALKAHCEHLSKPV